MNPKDHEKISPKDHQMFEQLLREYYKKPYDESYQLLREKIKTIFRSKDTNSKYRATLLDDLEDLTLTVIFRLMSFNSKTLKEKDGRIRNLEWVVSKIACFVYKEELKAIRKRLDEQSLDEDASAGKALQIAQPVNDEIQAIQNQIMRECYADCVEKLPAKNRAVFLKYYPDDPLPPGELVAVRQRLANEVAELTEAQAQSQTKEQQVRTLNNLQSKVNKWRKSRVGHEVRRSEGVPAFPIELPESAVSRK